jgi:hypothetical protein
MTACCQHVVTFQQLTPLASRQAVAPLRVTTARDLPRMFQHAWFNVFNSLKPHHPGEPSRPVAASLSHNPG